jgi:hypothetical protein
MFSFFFLLGDALENARLEIEKLKDNLMKLKESGKSIAYIVIINNKPYKNIYSVKYELEAGDGLHG